MESKTKTTSSKTKSPSTNKTIKVKAVKAPKAKAKAVKAPKAKVKAVKAPKDTVKAVKAVKIPKDTVKAVKIPKDTVKAVKVPKDKVKAPKAKVKAPKDKIKPAKTSKVTKDKTVVSSQKRKPRAKKSVQKEQVVKQKEVKIKKSSEKKVTRQKKKTAIVHPELNIGTTGHVDEGKSTLVQSLTGKFPDDHSEEIKRGITIRLGYADADIYECKKCPIPEKFTINQECTKCKTKTTLLRRVSFVDAPGHEILMQVMLSGGAIMDGVILVISANKNIPQPQTREHLAAITALGIQNIIIVQNKIELVRKDELIKNYQAIKNFLKGTIAQNAPIIPMSAIHKINIDLLLAAIQHFVPTPPKNNEHKLRMYVARSFDINRPGCTPMELRGGVFGGSIKSGLIKINDKILVQPGIMRKSGKSIERIPLETEVISIKVGANIDSKYADSGGLVAIQTTIDPSMTRSDNLSGSIITDLEHPLETLSSLKIQYTLFDSVVGSNENEKVKPLIKNEPLLLTIGTASITGIVTSISKKAIEMKLSAVIALDRTIKIALSRKIQKRWRLIGYGETK